jgi:hypothetical protein
VREPLIRDYLAGTRIVDERPIGPLVPVYEQMFAACVRRLNLEADRPALYVTRTAQAMSETIAVGEGRHVVIYDQYQGRVNHRLNRFAYEDFPVDVVVRFFLRHTRIAFATAGSIHAAALAGVLKDKWPLDGAPSPEPAGVSRMSTRLATSFQECFVIAHELAHLALERGRFPRGLQDLTDHVVQKIATEAPGPGDDAVKEYLRRENEEQDTAGWDAIVGRLGHRRSGEAREPAMDYEEFEAYRKDLPSQLARHPQLREEATCDLLASMAVIGTFGVDASIAVPAMVLALANHTTLALMRQRIGQMVSEEQAAEHDERKWSVMPIALRGWVLLRVWQQLVGKTESAKAREAMGRLVFAQRERHARRVRAVAEEAPFLVFAGYRAGVVDQLKARGVPPLFVRDEILADMGSDGR